MNTPAGGVTLPELPVDIRVLARRLQSAAYNNGQTDGEPYRSDKAYRVASDKSDAALAKLVEAIADLEARAALAGEWRDIASAPDERVLVCSTTGYRQIVHGAEARGVNAACASDGEQPHYIGWQPLPLPAAPLPKEPGR